MVLIFKIGRQAFKRLPLTYKEKSMVQIVSAANIFDLVVGKQNIAKTEYRLINNGLDITEYANIPLPDHSIKKITIGPKCKLGENELRIILNDYLGYEPEVSKSTSSYR